MDDIIIARAIHILSVLFWIGGVAFVTLVVMPSIRGSTAPDDTRTIDLPRIGLRPVESMNPRAPAYEVVALNVARRWVQIGALWEAASKKTGEMFLAGTVDDPGLPEPLPIALFSNESGGYSIAWRRDTLRSDFGGSGFGAQNYSASERDDSQGAMQGGFGDSTAGMHGELTGADLDDEIPFA